MCVRIRITPPYPYLRAHMPIGHIWPIKRDLSSIVIKAMPNFVLLKSPFFLLQGKLVTLFNSLSPPALSISIQIHFHSTLYLSLCVQCVCEWALKEWKRRHKKFEMKHWKSKIKAYPTTS